MWRKEHKYQGGRISNNCEGSVIKEEIIKLTLFNSCFWGARIPSLFGNLAWDYFKVGPTKWGPVWVTESGKNDCLNF